MKAASLIIPKAFTGIKIPKVSFANGATRNVLMIGDLVFKVPRLQCFHKFLYGMAANENERLFSKYLDSKGGDKRFAPVIFGIPYFLVVMRKADKVGYLIRPKSLEQVSVDERGIMQIDIRPENVGYYGKVPKIIDYGNHMWSMGYGFSKNSKTHSIAGYTPTGGLDPYPTGTGKPGTPTGGW